jgi:hypothetical protein
MQRAVCSWLLSARANASVFSIDFDDVVLGIAFELISRFELNRGSRSRQVRESPYAKQT